MILTRRNLLLGVYSVCTMGIAGCVQVRVGSTENPEGNNNTPRDEASTPTINQETESPTPTKQSTAKPENTPTETEEVIVETETPEPKPDFGIPDAECVAEKETFSQAYTVSCQVTVSNYGGEGSVEVEAIAVDVPGRPTDTNTVRLGPDERTDILLEVSIPAEYAKNNDYVDISFAASGSLQREEVRLN